MIQVREAEEKDVAGVREIFVATYGRDYPHPEFFELPLLKKLVFDDETLLLVAEEEESGRLLGTASVIFDIGAFGDLVGEFGRLAVHPDGRKRGIGKLLMEERLKRIGDRLQLAIVENRACHPYSQRISAEYGFHPVGFLPRKLLFAERESIALYVKHFGDALKLRRNHPRVIPEAFTIAELALQGCGIAPDAIVDDESAAYPHETGFDLEMLTAEGYSALFRLERGRVAHLEVFGPARLVVGLFKIRASRSNYLVAREKGAVVGALGYTMHAGEKTINIFEIISVDERPIRFLVNEFVRLCREELKGEYVEVDVSAYAPRMQRTFLEAGFLPVAYIPSMAFHKVERRDGVKMALVRGPVDLTQVSLAEASVPLAEAVTRNFQRRISLPRVTEAMPEMALFAGLNEEQQGQLAGRFALRNFEKDEVLFREGDPGNEIYVILSGEVRIGMGDSLSKVGRVGPGNCVGEISLIKACAHTATAVTLEATEAAVLQREDFQALVRLRPDLGVVVYRNLAAGLGEKLLRADGKLAAASGT